MNPDDAADALADADNDEMNNRGEYVVGTNPNDASSVFRINLAVNRLSKQMSYASMLGRLYTLFYTDDLASGLSTPVPRMTDEHGSGGVGTFVEATESPKRFYRAQVKLP